MIIYYCSPYFVLPLRTHLVGRHGDGLLGVRAAGRRVAGGGCTLVQDDADQISGDDAAGCQGLTGVRQELRAVQRQAELCVRAETQTGNTGSRVGPHWENWFLYHQASSEDTPVPAAPPCLTKTSVFCPP